MKWLLLVSGGLLFAFALSVGRFFGIQLFFSKPVNWYEPVGWVLKGEFATALVAALFGVGCVSYAVVRIVLKWQ